MTIDPRWTPADLAARWRGSVATVMARLGFGRGKIEGERRAVG